MYSQAWAPFWQVWALWAFLTSLYLTVFWVVLFKKTVLKMIRSSSKTKMIAISLVVFLLECHWICLCLSTPLRWVQLCILVYEMSRGSPSTELHNSRTCRWLMNTKMHGHAEYEQTDWNMLILSLCVVFDKYLQRTILNIQASGALLRPINSKGLWRWQAQSANDMKGRLEME